MSNNNTNNKRFHVSDKVLANQLKTIIDTNSSLSFEYTNGDQNKLRIAANENYLAKKSDFDAYTSQTDVAIQSIQSEQTQQNNDISSLDTSVQNLDTFQQNLNLSKADKSITITSSGGIIGSGDLSSNIVLNTQNYVKSSLSTGLIKGGVVSSVAASTVFSITSGFGLIVDNESDQTNPVIKFVTISSRSNVAITNVLTSRATWILVDSLDTLIQQITEPTAAQLRQTILLGKINHWTNSTVGVVCESNSQVNTSQQFHNVVRHLGIINLGCRHLAAGANMNINLIGGYLIGDGINSNFDTSSPNVRTIANLNLSSFYMATQTSIISPAVTKVPNAANYDLNGTVTANGGANGSAMNIRVFLCSCNILVLQYGQIIYTSLANAVAALQTESFVVNPQLDRNNAVMLGWICVVKNATALNNAAQASLRYVGMWGDTLSGAGGSLTYTGSNGVLVSGSVVSGVNATTSTVGVVQLSDSVSGTLSTLAATEKSVGLKTDKVVGATLDNVATLTASGNLLDSGKSFSTDDTFASNSDLKIPTEKAIKTYVSANAGAGSVAGLSGDVVGSGSGTISTTIQPNVVDNSKLSQVPALTWKGNSSGSLATPSDNLSGSLTELDSSVLSVANGSNSLLKNVSIKLNLANNKVFIGDANNVPVAQTISGDITLSNTGVSTIKSSVNLSGSPTTTTQAQNNNSTAIATTSYVDTSAYKKLDKIPASLIVANLATGGSIGLATNTVDLYERFSINQTTANQNITLPAPTNLSNNKIVFVENIGTTSFNISDTMLPIGAGTYFTWSGSVWLGSKSVQKFNFVNINSNSVVSNFENIFLVDCSTSSIFITLPTIISKYYGLNNTFKKIDASTNCVTILANGSDLIDGQAVVSIFNQYETLEINCGGPNKYYITGDSRNRSANVVSRLFSTVNPIQSSFTSGNVLFNTIVYKSGNGINISNGVVSIDPYLDCKIEAGVSIGSTTGGSATFYWQNAQTLVAVGVGGSAQAPSNASNNAIDNKAIHYHTKSSSVTTYVLKIAGTFDSISVASNSSFAYVDIVQVNNLQTASSDNSTDYIYAKLSANVSNPVDCSFNTVVSSNNIVSSPPLFNLYAGKTYQLTCFLACANSGSSEVYTFQWVTSNNVSLGGTIGAIYGTAIFSFYPPFAPAVVIYTPTTNVSVKIRRSASAGTPQLVAAYSYASIVQIGNYSTVNSQTQPQIYYPNENSAPLSYGLALRTKKRVHVVGSNSNFVAGIGTTSTETNWKEVFIDPSMIFDLDEILDLWLDYDSAAIVARNVDGNKRCFVCSSSGGGSRGNGSITDALPYFTQVNGGSILNKQVEAIWGSSFIIYNSSSFSPFIAKCVDSGVVTYHMWGNWSSGNGIDATVVNSTPRQLTFFNNIHVKFFITTGNATSCFALECNADGSSLATGGRLWSVGVNTTGQLGIGSTTSQNTFVQATISTGAVLTDVVQVYCSFFSDIGTTATTHVIRYDGGNYTVWGTGDGTYNLIGYGSTTSTTRFVQCKLNSTTNLTNIKKIRSHGNCATYALSYSNILYGCGVNSYGTLNKGNTTAQTYFVQIDTNVKDFWNSKSPFSCQMYYNKIFNSNLYNEFYKTFFLGTTRFLQSGTGTEENGVFKSTAVPVLFHKDEWIIHHDNMGSSSSAGGNSRPWAYTNKNRFLFWGAADSNGASFPDASTCNVPREHPNICLIKI